MFEDIVDKTVGELKDELVKFTKDLMVDIEDVVGIVISESKRIISKNKDDLNDIANDLSDIGDALPKDTINDIIDAVYEKFKKK